MYDLQFRLKIPDIVGLKPSEKKDYMAMIRLLLQDIKPEIIMEHKLYDDIYKFFALSLKYRKTPQNFAMKTLKKNGECSINNYVFCHINNIDIEVSLITTKGNNLIIEGLFKSLLPINKVFEFLIDNPDTQKDLEKIDTFSIPAKNVKSLGINIIKMIGYKLSIPLNDNKGYSFYLSNKETGDKFQCHLNFTKTIKSNYIVRKNFLISTKQNKLVISKHNLIKHLKYELIYWTRLLSNANTPWLFAKNTYVIVVRALYHIVRPLLRHELWIFSDRAMKAGDNGQALFEYAMKQNNSAYKYFAISKQSTDYNLMKKVGKVISIDSYLYRFMCLISDKLISSHATALFMNPFGRNRTYFYDLYKFQFIFLQHGIIKDDLSKWLHKYNKDIKLFVTSAHKEYESIVNGAYGYSKTEVKLTGLPRYDKLKNNPKKKILLMPTWRKWLAGSTNSIGIHQPNPAFTDSPFFKFYNTLINDDHLIELLNNKGYVVKFCLHPNHICESNKFDNTSSIVKISENICDYTAEFAEGSLLVTDYSSTAFDFAYLKKPIIYAQFDKTEFWSGKQVYSKGYFSYENDGFGKVCYDLNSTIDEIVRLVNNDCVMDQKYVSRVKNFYAFNDRKNCERVWNEIVKL